MQRKKKQNFLLLSLLLCIILIAMYKVPVKAVEKPTIDQPILATAGKNISRIVTKIVYDTQGNFHVFAEVAYYNGSFVLIHIVNGEMKVVDKESRPAEVFDVFVFAEGVACIYSYEGEFYGFIVKMYYWTEGYGEVKILFTSTEYLYPVSVEQSKDAIHLFTKTNYDEQQTIVNHYTFFLNGSELEESYSLPFPSSSYVQSVLTDKNVYILFRTTNYFSENYSTFTTFQIVKVTEGGFTNLSRVSGLEEGYYEAELKVDENETFNLLLLSYDSLYSARFLGNSNLTISDFGQKTLSYPYYDGFESFIYENVSYYCFYTTLYAYYLESSSSNGNLIRPRIEIFEVRNNTIQSTNFIIDNGVEEYYQQFVSSLILENGSYIITYNSLLSQKEKANYRLVASSVITVNIYSNLQVDIPQNMFLFGIKSLSPFAYFWSRNWYAFAIPIIMITSIYGLFRKKINEKIRKLRNYLLRPIVSEASKTKLVFINIWLFVTNAGSLVFSLWKSNKKRLIVSLLGFTLLASIIVTSTTLYDSKRTSLITEYMQRYDLANNDLVSGTANLKLESGTISTKTVFTSNFTDMIRNEIYTSIETFSVDVARIVNGLEIVFYTGVSGFNLYGNLKEFDYLSYVGYNDSYFDLIDSLLLSGRLPSSKGEVLIPQALANVGNITLNDYMTINATSSSLMESCWNNYEPFNRSSTNTL
ncbi:MAG: hypothetical protein ACTSSG_12680 [Candidatus Heimdallarchaeaceae archaeon]